LKKNEKSVEWVDFSHKIVYLYEKLFHNDKEKLILYFSDFTSTQKPNSRKKTIENWLEGKTKKPNGFHLTRFKISEFQYKSQPLLTTASFKKWSFETFQNRVDQFLSEKEIADVPNKMKYIYFFSTIEKRLSYFEILYPDADNHAIIRLISPTYTRNITYNGKITIHSSMCYINVHTDFDHMNFIFKNNVEYYTDKINVFGVAQSVDGFSRKPKAFLTLLTSKKLTEYEEPRLAHKLNYSNLMIADDFSDGCALERDYFLENFSEKIRDLSRDTHHYDIHQQFEEDMYFDIILQEYKTYIELLEQSLNNNDYPINHKRQSILFALEHMCRDKKEKATILYHLDADTINILNAKNSIMDMQLTLVKEGKLILSYFFLVDDISLLTKHVIEQLRYIEANGVAINFTLYDKSIYSKILIVANKNFAIYKRKNEISDNHVTRSANTIEQLNYEVKVIEKKSISLDKLLKKSFPLDGKWYHYSYNSKHDANAFQEMVFEISNYTFTANYVKGKRKGKLLQTDEYTLILLQHSIIRIHNIYLKEKIFYVSIIGKEMGIHHKDVLLFGLFSKEQLSKEQALFLLNSIHQKGDEEFRVKIANDFDSTLAYFNVNK